VFHEVPITRSNSNCSPSKFIPRVIHESVCYHRISGQPHSVQSQHQSTHDTVNRVQSQSLKSVSSNDSTRRNLSLSHTHTHTHTHTPQDKAVNSDPWARVPGWRAGGGIWPMITSTSFSTNSTSQRLAPNWTPLITGWGWSWGGGGAKGIAARPFSPPPIPCHLISIVERRPV